MRQRRRVPHCASRLGIRCLLPPVLDNEGHIPNLLQDLLLQVYAGLQAASELDRAVTFFREAGHWPSCLQHVPTQALPDVPPDVEAAVGHVPGVPHDPPHGVESSCVPPAGNADTRRIPCCKCAKLIDCGDVCCRARISSNLEQFSISLHEMVDVVDNSGQT